MTIRNTGRLVVCSSYVASLALGSLTAAAALAAPRTSHAQGIGAAAARGRVSDANGHGIESRVRVTQAATGFSVEDLTHDGRFFVQGLEPGGPYTISAHGLGYAAQRRDSIFLALGEIRESDFVLQPIASLLDTVTIAASGGRYGNSHSDGGTGTTISASVLDRLPTLNRDLYDFVRLVPQISTRISLSNPGMSAAGMGFRFNNFLINGVSDRTLSGGVSSAFAGAKSIPLDAVQEYQVLLSPYDVLYGDFAGGLVNAVTRSGTNTLRGSAFVYGRNDRLRRDADTLSSRYEREQYGVSVGGPLVRNRLHFFAASEFQRFTYPAPGPYVGQPDDSKRAVPVSTADLDRFDAIMKRNGLTAGSAGPLDNGNPLRNLFARLDLSLPEWNSRIFFWNNYGSSDDIALSRAARDTFSLSSYRVTRASRTNTSALQIHTNLRRIGGAHNELLISRRSDRLDPIGAVQQPIVRVAVSAASGGRVTLNSGTHETAQTVGFRSSDYSVTDNLSFAVGPTELTIGGQAERFHVSRGTSVGAYGSWSFGSLADLDLGVADQYEVRVDFENADAPIGGRQYAAYASDRWQAGERLVITTGLRGDLLGFSQHAPYNRAVDSIFGRRTDEMPRRRVEFSPRIGFTWDIPGRAEHRFRGGAGIFAGRYPLAWAHSALSSYGVGGLLRCSRVGPGRGAPPAFTPDYLTPPTACSGGSTITAADPGDVDLVDRNLRMTRVARASIAYDRRLPWNLLLTNEALFTRALSDFVFANLNLAEPLGTDPYGRVMYGTIATTGAATARTRSPFLEVIELRNTGRNRSWLLSTRLEKSQREVVSAFVSYTYSRARDVQTPLRVNTRGTTAWASARVTSGRDDDYPLGISSNDIPHRVVAGGAYSPRSLKGRTLFSFYYVGESGRPFTFTAYGTLRRGDLNADGSSNDPIYVPRSALDTLEVLFSGFSDAAGADNSPAAQADRERAQRTAFESFIERTSCLRRQRGKILERNSCREPWSNTTIASARQAIPVGGNAFEVQLDVFNVLNVLNAGWGLRREAAPALLEHFRQSSGSVQASRPVFRFDATSTGLTTSSTESAFQMQLAMRYRF
ncbi:MAG: TonB-dependent receptor [Gemmatimonas sp.]